MVIIEGIYAFNQRLKHLLDLHVSIAGRLRYAITASLRFASMCGG
jgi:uridine kinase